MNSLEAILAIAGYLSIALVILLGLGFASEKAALKHDSSVSLASAEECAFASDIVYLGTAGGEMDSSFNCTAKSEREFVSVRGSRKAFAQTVAAKISPSAGGKGAVKINGRKHYG